MTTSSEGETAGLSIPWEKRARKLRCSLDVVTYIDEGMASWPDGTDKDDTTYK